MGPESIPTNGSVGYFGVLSETFIKSNNGIDIPW